LANDKDELQIRIHQLKSNIEEKIIRNKSLKITMENLKEKTLRYKNIFDKSYISLWEEDAEDTYKILKTLPCDTGKELSLYLSVHPEIIIQLVQKLKIIDINDYTTILFESKNKTQLYDILSKGELLTEKSFPGFITLFAAMIDGLPHCQDEIILYTINGKKLNLLMTTILPEKGKGNILISMMDISLRKQQEEYLGHTIKKAETEKNRKEVLQNILLTLTSSLNEEEILNTILRDVKKIVPYSCANIRLLKDNKLIVAGWTGYEEFGASNFIDKNSIPILDLGDSKKILESGEIIIISDTTKDPDWTNFSETSFIKAYIGIPIKWDSETIGLLSLDSNKINAFTQYDSEMLRTFAHAASTAMQSSRLFELTNDEIKKRVEIENSIKKSLKEKEILLREIHHRVKNNLSLIMSLINLQSNMLPDHINQSLFEDLKQRVYTIALVHEKLYSSIDLHSIDIKSYLLDLTEAVKTSSIFKKGVIFFLDVENSVRFDSDTLVPLALLLNELLINSVKYAFPIKPGEIHLKFTTLDDSHIITLRDNGIGFPENQETSASQIGLFLVQSLAAQIGGSVSFKNENGAVSTLIFPKKLTV
jgi:two-component sensor histidine kinase/putative methionine-R-sulfoxide reductase with GAF domain